MAEALPNITVSYTIIRPKIFGAAPVVEFPIGPARSIPAQVGMPIVFPAIIPSVGKEHPHEGSIATDEGKVSRAMKNDPTLEK